MTFSGVTFLAWCPKCTRMNSPDEGEVTESNIMILKYICGFCGHKFDRKIPLPDVTVEPLALHHKAPCDIKDSELCRFYRAKNRCNYRKTHDVRCIYKL